MKQFFHKSNLFLLFFASVSFVLTTGFSLLMDFSIGSEDILFVKIATYGSIALMLMNFMDILSYWIIGRTKEMFVRRLVGSTPLGLLVQLLLQTQALGILAFILGLVLAIVTAHMTGFVTLRIQAALNALLIGMVLNLVFSTGVIACRVKAIYGGGTA